jgi:hypothetical protein
LLFQTLYVPAVVRELLFQTLHAVTQLPCFAPMGMSEFFESRLELLRLKLNRFSVRTGL